MGKKVTIVEMAPQILTLFDEDFAGYPPAIPGEERSARPYGGGP